MVALVEGLLAKGVAYKGEDGSVYFSIERFPAYGRLSQLDKRELRTGASGRVASDEYAKEDARDFALWKAAQPQDEAVGAAWDAPFGRGRPGWHLECSAMALDLIGEKYGVDVLDIHAGGVDLIFPHHEDEIAQSCAYTGKPDFARYWMHGEFLNIRGTKMSKRFGNYTTPRDLKADGVDAGAVRLLVFQTHYRQKLDLTDDALDGAREGARRLGEFGDRLARAAAGAGSPAESAAAATLRSSVTEAMNDDLNAPRAVAALFDFVREANRLLDGSKSAGPELRSAWEWAGQVLDVAGVDRPGRRDGWTRALVFDEAPPAGRESRVGAPGGRIAGWRRRRAVTSSWLMRYATGSRPTASRSATRRTARRWSGSARESASRAAVLTASRRHASRRRPAGLPTGYPRVPPAVDLSLSAVYSTGLLFLAPAQFALT